LVRGSYIYFIISLIRNKKKRQKRQIRYDDFYLLSGVLIGKCTGNPLSTEVVGLGIGGELEDGSLGIGSAGANLSNEETQSE
jgi:hypothetical protein